LNEDVETPPGQPIRRGISVMTSDNQPRQSPSSNQSSGQPAGRSGMPSLLAYVPVGWLAVVMILSLRGLISTFPLLSTYGLPESVWLLVYGGMAVSTITLLWGLYMLGLAIKRSPRFPRHFTIWQIATIVWLVAHEAYIAITPDFGFNLQTTATAAIEIAIGLFCLYLLRQNRDAATLYGSAETAAPSLLVSIIAAILGVIVGGTLGFGIGLGAGIAMSEAANMSCFEGACGFFAFFVGLAGILVGAIVGGIFAVRRVNRRPKPAIPSA